MPDIGSQQAEISRLHLEPLPSGMSPRLLSSRFNIMRTSSAVHIDHLDIHMVMHHRISIPLMHLHINRVPVGQRLHLRHGCPKPCHGSHLIHKSHIRVLRMLPDQLFIFRKAHRAGQKIISFAQIQLFHLFFPFCQSFQFPDHVLPLSKHFPCFTRISFL